MKIFTNIFILLSLIIAGSANLWAQAVEARASLEVTIVDDATVTVDLYLQSATGSVTTFYVADGTFAFTCNSVLKYKSYAGDPYWTGFQQSATGSDGFGRVDLFYNSGNMAIPGSKQKIGTFTFSYTGTPSHDVKWDRGNSGMSFLDLAITRPVNISFTDPSTFTLPVEMTAFDANAAGGAVNLSWETATEVNNYGFEVQRAGHTPSLSGHPSLEGSNWETIGFVKGNGNSNSVKRYNFTDKALAAAGKYSYRLKQIDIDGACKYSDEKTVSFAGLNYALEQNYPNPFNPTTTISYTIPQGGFVSFKVYNLIGQEVRVLENSFKAAGNYSVKFNASDLNSGIYIYRLQAGEFSAIRKMQVIK